MGIRRGLVARRRVENDRAGGVVRLSCGSHVMYRCIEGQEADGLFAQGMV